MLPTHTLFMALISRVAYTNENAKTDDEFMAIALVNQEHCPQLNGTSTCNSISNVFEADVPDFPVNNISETVNNISQTTTTMKPAVTGVQGSAGKECCGKCDCEKDCLTYGSCCPEMYTSFADAKAAVDSSRFTCVTPRYISSKDKTDFISAHGLENVWMIAKCKPGVARYLDDRIVAKCLRPASNSSLRSLVPVTDGVLHYRNKFCGLCNGKDFTQFTSWKVEVACHDLIDVQIDDSEFLQTVTEQRCNVFYWPPTNIPTVECKMPVYSISTCNETGYWLEYNETIDRACDSFLDPFNLTYKNYFCYLCNKYETGETGTCKLTQDIQSVTPPFSALLGVGGVHGEESEEQLSCDVLKQFSDDKMMMCRDIHCAEHRYLESFECVIKQGQTVSKCYQLFVKLNVSQGQIYATLFNGITNMLLTVQRVLDMVPLDFTSLRKFTIYKKNFENDNFRLIDYVVAELLVETRGTPESDTEVKIYQNLHGNSFIMDGVTYDTELDTYVTEFVTHKAFPEPIEMLRIPHSNLSLFDLLPPIYSESFPADNDGENLCSGNMSSPYYKIRFCPYLEIGLGEWNIEIENGTLRLEKEFTTQSFTKWEYDITENGLIICLEDFQSIYASLPSRVTVKPSTNDTISTKRILAFICSILSLVSLLITIVVYLLLPKLQSQPGINNVILCICLFLAQSLYQFGAGQTSLSYWECSLIGAFSHFFWLSAMFSMNSCSVQMFLIFKSSVKVTPKFRMKHTLKYVSYVVLASLACVVINVTVSVIKSGGQESGYGGNICYISSYIMNVVTFIIPTGCTVIANIVLFAYVIFKIEKSNVSSTKMNVERNYFGVYARLSTLTGLTWIFGFILLFVESEVCEYLFIIFNASQGLLIMIAFIFNHRVFSLCCGEKGLIRTSIGMMSSKKSRSSGSMVDRSAANRSGMSEPEPQPSTSYAYYSSS